MSRDEAALARGLAVYQRRFRLAALARALSIGSVAASLLAVLLGLADRPAGEIRLTAVALLALIAGLASMYWWRQWTPAQVARAIEARDPGLDNLVVTAQEMSATRRRPHRLVRDELFAAALSRLETASPARIQPLAFSLSIAALTTIAAIVSVTSVPGPPSRRLRGRLAPEARDSIALLPGDIRIVVTPPAYTGLGPQSHVNVPEVRVIEGSRVRFETAAVGRLDLVETGRGTVPLSERDGRWSYELTAARSQVFLVQQLDTYGARGVDRLVHLRVDPDRRPVVRIVAPARDLIFGTPAGQVPVEIEANDDLGLASIALRYTRVAGSGETFTFEEGDVPLQVARASNGQWRARATLSLAALRLADGDALVYRALASDRKPGADPSASESFLIEIGRLAGVAATGFAIPEERDRQAISQQMLILKTERLEAERAKLPREAFEEQSRLLAVEQRMVKAEFVFMTGGEVADEVEEAEHAHELAEGRLENAAQVELLTAIREMSRAEAQLNAADTSRALTFERAALAALQRAFDRRRYLLRALPERTRIDPTRRLSGDRSSVRAAGRPVMTADSNEEVDRARTVLIELGRAANSPEALNAALAARVLAIDPASDALQKIVIPLATGRDEARAAAARDAQRYLVDRIRTRLAATAQSGITAAPAVGRFADEMSRAPGQR